MTKQINVTVKLIEGSEAIGKFIASNVASRGKQLDRDIHIAACSAGQHFAAHGDVFQINNLYKSMPKGARHVALTDWLTKFAGVSANADKATNKDKPFEKDANKKADITEGMKNPWYSLKPSKNPDEVVDLYAMLLKLVSKAKKDGAQLANGEMLEPLEALLEAHKPTEDADADEVLAE